LAEFHLKKCAEIKKEKGKQVDDWLQNRVDSINNGHKYGVKITAIKPKVYSFLFFSFFSFYKKRF